MSDPRPAQCRFRLQDEGKAYPRSSCGACGRTIMTGLGRQCHLQTAPATKPEYNQPSAFEWTDDLHRACKLANINVLQTHFHILIALHKALNEAAIYENRE